MNGQSLGKVLWETRNKIAGKFKPDIDKPSDTQMERAIKNIIKDMLEVEPEDRPTISDVVRRLTEVRVREDIAAKPSGQGASSSSKIPATAGKC